MVGIIKNVTGGRVRGRDLSDPWTDASERIEATADEADVLIRIW